MNEHRSDQARSVTTGEGRCRWLATASGLGNAYIGLIAAAATLGSAAVILGQPQSQIPLAVSALARKEGCL